MAGVALAGLLALTGCGARAAHGGGVAGPATPAPTSASASTAASSPATTAPREDESPSQAPAPAVDQQEFDSASSVVDDAERTLDAIDQEMAQDE